MQLDGRECGQQDEFFYHLSGLSAGDDPFTDGDDRIHERGQFFYFYFFFKVDRIIRITKETAIYYHLVTDFLTPSPGEQMTESSIICHRGPGKYIENDQYWRILRFFLSATEIADHSVFRFTVIF